MYTLRIKKKIDSEILYLHLPEFKNMIGKNVEIIIAIAEQDGQVTRDISELEGFLKPPSVPVTIEEMNAVIRSRGSRLCYTNSLSKIGLFRS